MKLLLQHGRLLDPVSGRDEQSDVLIVDGVIERTGEVGSVAGEVQRIDLRGKVVAPGFLDLHVHLREPGFEHKESIETGCASAAAGGFTGVCCMPNTNPAIDEESVARYIIEKGKQVLHGIVDVYPVAAATKGRKGLEISPMAELVHAGAVGFSDDGAPVTNAEIMRRVFEYSSMFGVPVIQHAEETSLTKGGVMNEGVEATRLGMPGMPDIAEELIVARDIILLRYIPKAKYHVAHLSTRGALARVAAAKKEGLHITAEATPHHFTLTDSENSSFDTNTKMNPPLRTRDDVTGIKEGLRDGTIDAIATDHAPHTVDEKEVEYSQAPFGIVGLETAVGLAITELVLQRYLTLDQLIAKFSTNPRRIAGLPPIKIADGERANLTLLDPSEEWVVDVQSFKSRSKNSPFHGRQLTGRAIGIVNNCRTLLRFTS